jgi:hypothetical protein
MLHHHYLLPILVVLVLGSFLAIPPVPSAHAADARCFPETGQCISGRIRAFWEQNGGLAVFGYPISAPNQESIRDTGSAYLTQWFERNRFEVHPENLPPYDVLLGRLGDDLLQRQGIDWQTLPREPGPRVGCLWFAQTGHNVCDQAPQLGFKTYWQAHGLHDPRLNAHGNSLALFGLPVTEARDEVNPTDGQTYRTQWFERARFEWHPDQPEAFKVLLGLLGNQQRIFIPHQLSASVTGQPIAGSFLYWVEPHGPFGTLYESDVLVPFPFAIADQVDLTVRPTAYPSGIMVAWVEDGFDGQQQRVRFYQASGRLAGPPGTTSVLLEANHHGMQIASLALANDVLYYTDRAPNHRGLYARAIADGTERLIDENGRDPVAADDLLLWSTMATNGQTGAGYRETWTLHMRQITSGEERVLTRIDTVALGHFSGYSGSSDFVVWAFSAMGADNRVYLYQISSGKATPISPDAASSPSIFINSAFVVWATDPFLDKDPGNTWSVQAYDIARGEIKTVAAGIAAQSQRTALLIGNQVAFTIDNGSPGDRMGRSQTLYLTGLP